MAQDTPEVPPDVQLRDQVAAFRDLFQAGDFAAAAEVGEVALALSEEAFGDQPETTGFLLLQLAKAHTLAGDFDAAAAHYDRARALFEDALGPNHWRTVDAITGQATLAAERGDTEAAIALYDEAIARSEAGEGLDNNFAGNAFMGRANQYIAIDDLEQAEADTRQALAIFDAIWGPVHPATGQAAATLAWLTDDVTEALSLYDDALNALRTGFGAAHPAAARLAFEYAETLMLNGLAPDAVDLLEPAVVVLARADAPEALAARDMLAEARVQALDVEAAVGAARRLMAQALASGDVNRAVAAQLRLADYELKRGNMPDAEALLGQIVARIDTAGIDDPLLRLHAMRQYATALSALGRLSRANEVAGDALALAMEVDGKDVALRRERAAVLATGARLALIVGRADVAVEAARAAVSLVSNDTDPQSDLRLTALITFAQALRLASDPVQADLVMTAVERDLSRIYDESGQRVPDAELVLPAPVAASLAAQLAQHWLALDQPVHAGRLVRMAEAIAIDDRSTDDSALIAAYRARVALAQSTGNRVGAIAAQRAMLDAIEATYGPNTPQLGQAATMLARLLARDGQPVRAEPLFAVAQTAIGLSLGSQHPLMVAAVSGQAALAADDGARTVARQRFDTALRAAEAALTHGLASDGLARETADIAIALARTAVEDETSDLSAHANALAAAQIATSQRLSATVVDRLVPVLAARGNAAASGLAERADAVARWHQLDRQLMAEYAVLPRFRVSATMDALAAGRDDALARVAAANDALEGQSPLLTTLVTARPVALWRLRRAMAGDEALMMAVGEGVSGTGVVWVIRPDALHVLMPEDGDGGPFGVDRAALTDALDGAAHIFVAAGPSYWADLPATLDTLRRLPVGASLVPSLTHWRATRRGAASAGWTELPPPGEGGWPPVLAALGDVTGQWAALPPESPRVAGDLALMLLALGANAAVIPMGGDAPDDGVLPSIVPTDGTSDPATAVDGANTGPGRMQWLLIGDGRTPSSDPDSEPDAQ